MHKPQKRGCHSGEGGFDCGHEAEAANHTQGADPMSVLTINGGSSSIKFALYQAGNPLERGLYGKVDRIGLPDTKLSFNGAEGNQKGNRSFAASDHKAAGHALIDWLEGQPGFSSVKAVGHRVVHGMKHTAPEVVSQELLDELHRLRPYDPNHLPHEIKLIEAFRERHPKLPQVACFDTAFHRTMPRVARLLPLPRHLNAKGIERYGFHGLSYAYLMEELERVAGAEAVRGRVILAHLGNGASMAAVLAGKSIDTSMGFTPTAGLPMSTRSGDLDPGLAPYLERTAGMTGSQFYKMVNHESGLLGISETSPDMRDLLEREAKDVRAAEAVALFCYQAKKWVGAFAAALGGLDTLVFSAGIGENCPPVRARICDELGFLGLKLSKARNAKNAPVISTEASQVTVRVIRTDEEQMIARSVCRLLGLGSGGG
jgi:acetate kinase